MKRIVAVLGAALLVVPLAGVVGGSGATAAPAAPAAPAAGLSWSNCGDLQCSTLEVPRDYANPGSGSITLQLTRKKHTRSPYRGLMLANPGGPGGSGTYLPVLSDYVPRDAGLHYDWVGWAPRGVAGSTPALRCNNRYFTADRPNFVPRTGALMRYWVTKTARYAKQCGTSNAAQQGLLPFLTTRDNVRDMESIRAAYQANAPLLDKPRIDKLNFYGFSYGTYLGQVYAVTYPTRVGRFVLDGVVGPDTWWYQANLKQEIWFDRNLDVFFRWLAAHPRVYRLGTSGAAIRRGFEEQLRKLDRRPAADGRLGPNELTDALLAAGYYVYGWDAIGRAYAQLVRNGRGAALYRMYAEGNLGDDNGYAMYLATQCTDVLRPPWTRQVRDAWKIHRTHPFLAWDNTWYNAPCRYWRASSKQRIPVYGGRAGVTAPILMINETYDAATPFSGALTSRGRFPSARLIEGYRGTTHSGSLSGVACVDNRIAQYLINGALPARRTGRTSDLRCPMVPPPPVAAARSTRGAGLPTWVRERLMGAQANSLRG